MDGGLCGWNGRRWAWEGCVNGVVCLDGPGCYCIYKIWFLELGVASGVVMGSLPKPQINGMFQCDAARVLTLPNMSTAMERNLDRETYFVISGPCLP